MEVPVDNLDLLIDHPELTDNPVVVEAAQEEMADLLMNCERFYRKIARAGSKIQECIGKGGGAPSDALKERRPPSTIQLQWMPLEEPKGGQE
ncbi:hypothetical protein FRX31_027898 [Thalictrum thalictroides]|uniref:Uncharacterized protein n=1 Tax=Thalictrum thalictroides TaxID=46969 RepID=A0A7J6VBQ3_THATH|nr:hypothetical protein FRX31_027898 [Thalictrum thalictroides]